MADDPRWEDFFSDQPVAADPVAAAPARSDPARSSTSNAKKGRGSRAASSRGMEPRRKRRWLAWLLSIVVVLGLATAGVGYAWVAYEPQIRILFGWELPPPDFDGQGSGEATIVIHSGDTGVEVTKALVEAGVVKNFDTFYKLLLAQDPAVDFFPGFYVLAKGMSSEAALAALQDPASRVENRALIQEGKTVDQIFDILSAATGIPVADFEAASKNLASFGIPSDAPNIEGYLFPATYIFDPGVDAASVLHTLVNRTFQSLEAAGVSRVDSTRILTIASLIQREAGSKSDDFFKVSRVIQNRLLEGMKLQFDSTAHYGYVWKHGEREDGGVFSTKAELEDDNPYNTYVIPGLPQGPIGAAGDLAIDAAMHPVDGPWLYFVTVNLDTGETVFSATNAEHNAAVRQLQQWCRTSQSPNCG